jgi:hypothetical protein
MGLGESTAGSAGFDFVWADMALSINRCTVDLMGAACVGAGAVAWRAGVRGNAGVV